MGQSTWALRQEGQGVGHQKGCRGRRRSSPKYAVCGRSPLRQKGQGGQGCQRCCRGGRSSQKYNIRSRSPLCEKQKVKIELFDVQCLFDIGYICMTKSQTSG